MFHEVALLTNWSMTKTI